MKPLNHFVVSVEKRFKDSIEVGGKELFLDSKFNEFEHRIAYGEIVGAPVRHNTGAEKGDTLFFHHHVITNANLALGNNEYICMYGTGLNDVKQAIAYRSKKDGKLRMLSDWIFVEPIEAEDGDIVSEGGIVLETAQKRIRKDVARVIEPDEELIRNGVKAGDVVGFDRASDYQMTLDDGSIVYRMRSEDISYVEES